ncbi:MAG: hypothetical protein ACLGI6_19635 [Gammaproteobacteria bacterium]
MYRVIRKRRVKRHPIVKAARILVLASPVLAAIVYAWYPKYPDYASESAQPPVTGSAQASGQSPSRVTYADTLAVETDQNHPVR